MTTFLLASLGIVLAGAGNGLIAWLDYVTVDRFSKRFKQRRRVLLGLVLASTVAAVCSLCVAYADKRADDIETEKERWAAAKAREDVAKARAEPTRAQSEADQAARRSSQEHGDLKSQLASVEFKLGPFIELAREKHAQLPEDQALIALHNDLAGLWARTKSLEEQIAPREISAETKAALKSRLGATSGCQVWVTSAGDQEGANFADQIRKAFAASSWATGGFVGTEIMTGGGGVFGVTLIASEGSKGPCYSAAASGLRLLDPNLHLETIPSGSPMELHVRIGSRPLK